MLVHSIVHSKLPDVSSTTAQNGPSHSQQPRQQQNRGPVTNAAPHSSQTSPPQPQQQPPPQQPQQRPAYPWSARRLLLPPPLVMPKPGAVPSTSPSPPPFPRYGHALPATATANGELYLFGGLVREAARNDLYLFSTRDLSATLVQTAGEIPSPRIGHASAIVSSVLIVWGGDTKTDPLTDPTEKQDDGLYLLNLGMYLRFISPTVLQKCALLTIPCPSLGQYRRNGPKYPCMEPRRQDDTVTP